MKFSKLHGFGNDFVVFDFDEIPTPGAAQAERGLHKAMTTNSRDRKAVLVEVDFVRSISDRKRGVGFDQLILLKTLPAQGLRKIVFLNADGSFAEMCGNGLRAAALFDLRKELIVKDHKHSVRKMAWTKNYLTDAGERRVTLLQDVSFAEIQQGLEIEFEAEMGVPEIKLYAGNEKAELLRALPGNHATEGTSFEFYKINVGNPHLVVRGWPASPQVFRDWGAALETHPFFPNRTNVEFFRFQMEHKPRIDALVWERGVGPTEACGTGAVALGAAALKELNREKVQASAVEIHFPGGKAEVLSGKGGVAILRGTAGFSFDGTLPLSQL